VLFVGTLGSVAGVLVTAFGLIPHLSNFSATLAVALALALLTAAAAAQLPAPLTARGQLGLTGACATLLAALLLWQADAYLARMWPASFGGLEWRVEARLGSRFGTLKVLRSVPDESSRFARIFFQDGLMQNVVDSDGRSLQLYTYALEALAYAYRPQLRSALVLGLGAGIVPMRLARQGVAVEVVEIDPASLAAATRFFGFDATRVPVRLADARTQLARCARRYDVIVVDLFHGDGTPEHLVTRDFFRDLRHCLAPAGVAVINTLAVLERPAASAHLLASLRSELPHIAVYRPDWPGSAYVNRFFVASAVPLPAPRAVTLDYVPPQHVEALPAMLARPQAPASERLEGGEVVTDARSRGLRDVAESQRIYRRRLTESLPPAFLVN
jgi:spermidine synthase